VRQREGRNQAGSRHGELEAPAACMIENTGVLVNF
jgi:hypothetical protein